MANWHKLALFSAVVLIALSLFAGCSGRTEETGNSGGSGGEGAGAGAAGGSAQGGAAACENARSSYVAALSNAKRCDPTINGEQCTLPALPHDCHCPTFVNPANAEASKELARFREIYNENHCGEGILCEVCVTPRRSFCNAAGQCEDDFGKPSAACLVNGRAYSHGATSIKDPFSCNWCTCNNGSLDCTYIDCETPCPPASLARQRCAQCGAAGVCELVETGCLPGCADGCPASAPACVSEVCSMLCE